MLNDYRDITSRIAETPKWWDEHGVPRYDDFHPDLLPDIYAHEAVLFLVTCQGCGHEFRVAMSQNAMDRAQYGSQAHLIRTRDLHYGDPPDIACCAAGPTMNSEPRRVLEYWRRGIAPDASATGVSATGVSAVVAAMGWVRDPALEVDITPDWVSEDPDPRDL